jgi:hypothetical protein
LYLQLSYSSPIALLFKNFARNAIERSRTDTFWGRVAPDRAARAGPPRRPCPPRLSRRRAPRGPLKSSPSSRGVPAVPRIRPAGRTAVGPVVTVVPPCRARRPRPWAPHRLDGRGRAQVQAGPLPCCLFKQPRHGRARAGLSSGRPSRHGRPGELPPPVTRPPSGALL